MRYFATAITGIAPVLIEEVRTRLDVERIGRPGFDGRNDVVTFEAGGKAHVTTLRTAEDVFVEAGSARRSGALSPLVRNLWSDAELARALSVYAAHMQPLRSRMSVRVIARVLSEREFLRTELRGELIDRVLAAHRRWRLGDPADIELWAIEPNRGCFRLGVRLTTAELRHRGGRQAERVGALRPTVAAAMVLLAGDSRGDLYDPFCGSGTILREAAAAGWTVAGSDVDPAAAETARRNLPSAQIGLADATNLPLADGSVDAVISNLPFGKEYELPGDRRKWFAIVLSELARITRDASVIVLLMPRSREFERAVEADPLLDLSRRIDIELLGLPTAIWRLTRR